MDTSDLRNGLHIHLDNDIYTVTEFQHVKPGKGGAFVRTRLKKLTTGQILDKTFRAGEKIESAHIEKKKMVFLYRQGTEYVLMDSENYDQIPVEGAMFGDQVKYLKEEMEVTAMIMNEQILGVEAPMHVELEITETDPGYRGDTVSGSSKPAKLETGAMVSVPFHINQGDIIKVDTRTNTYIERVKR